jgi:helix-turn-helix protein
MRNTMGGDGSPRAPRKSGVVGLHVVPKWEELAADSSKAWVLDPRTIRAHTDSALAALKTATAVLDTLRNVQLELFPVPEHAANGRNHPADPEKQWMSVHEAAAILHRSPRWIYRNARRFPFVHRLTRKTVLISATELDDWLSAHKP